MGQTLKSHEVPPGMRLRFSLDAERHDLRLIEWSPTGKNLLGISGNGTAWLWDIESGEICWRVKHFLGVPSSLAWSPDGRYWVVGTWQGPLQLCGAGEGSSYESYRGFTGAAVGVDWSIDGDRILAVSEKGEFAKWEMFSGRQLRSITLHGDNANRRCAVWSPDRLTVAIGSASGRVECRHVSDWGIVWAIGGNNAGSANSIAWSHDGRILARAAEGQSMHLWLHDDARSLWSNELPLRDPWQTTDEISPPIRVLKENSGTTCATLSVVNPLLVSQHRDKHLAFWNYDSGDQLARVPCDPGEMFSSASVCFHPHSSLLATVAAGGMAVHVWEIEVELLMQGRSSW